MTLTQVTKAGLHTIALDHVFTIGASGTDHYTFQGEGLNGTVNDPTLYLTRGKTYRFENGTGAHPIRIQSTSGASGTAYNTGVTNNAGSGTVIVEVQHDAPDVLYYQCTSHANMNGILYITGALADGGVTTAKLAADAVTGAKIADDAISADHYAAGSVNTTALGTDCVTGAKVADDALSADHYSAGSVDTTALGTNAVTAAKIADEAVTLAKLPHGDGSSDGKFLRANNGADPSFETVSIPAGTTINNNADDRVITGSGTANTLNGESTMTYTSNTLKLQDGANDTSLLHIVGAGTATRGLKIGTSQATGASNNDGAVVYDAIDSESNAYGAQHRFKIAGTDCFTIGYNGAKGYVGINDTVPYPDAIGGNTVDTCLELGGSMTGNDKASVIKLNGRASGSANKCQLQWAGANNRFDITVNGNTALQIQANKDVEITDGNLVIGTSGHGIDFSATSNSTGTMSNELLDDYEEGSWTPSFYAWSGGGTPATTDHAYGRYVKIGRCVYVMFDIQADRGNMGGSYINIAGLPFTTYGTGLSSRGGWATVHRHKYVGGENSTSSVRGVALEFGGGATVHAWLYGYTTGAGGSTYIGSYLPTSYMSNNNHTALYGNGFYFTEQ